MKGKWYLINHQVFGIVFNQFPFHHIKISILKIYPMGRLIVQVRKVFLHLWL
jgi:hypothetical protein